MTPQRPNHALQRNPAIALRLQSWRPVGRVAELGMRSLVFAIVFLILAKLVNGQEQPMLRATRLSNEVLTRILVEGKERDLRRVPGRDRPQAIIRLYAVAEEGRCVDGTHMVCSYQYYLAVGDLGEAAPQAVYDLGKVGELRPVAWLGRTASGRVQLRVSVASYPAYVDKYSPKLSRKALNYVLQIGTDSLDVVPER
jgi:hypothetical protein